MTEASPLHAITGDENVLVLAPRPGDETRFCGGLVAESCARGRPPFVAILTDGSSIGAARTQAARAEHWERATRTATAALGLPPARLLMIGLYDTTVPHDGPAFDALTKAITLIMWARDCNVICVPWDSTEPDRMAARKVAEAVAETSGVALIYAGPHQLRLDTSAHPAALHAYGFPANPSEEYYSKKGQGSALDPLKGDP